MRMIHLLFFVAIMGPAAFLLYVALWIVSLPWIAWCFLLSTRPCDDDETPIDDEEPLVGNEEPPSDDENPLVGDQASPSTGLLLGMRIFVVRASQAFDTASCTLPLSLIRLIMLDRHNVDAAGTHAACYKVIILFPLIWYDYGYVRRNSMYRR